MANPFLLTRVLLRFDTQSDDLLGELSAAALGFANCACRVKTC